MNKETVASDKLIIALPFYTRLWKENGKTTSTVVNMIDISIPAGAKKTWDDTTKQNYIEWRNNSIKYKEWIEDKESISAKLDLVNKYHLGGAGFWEKDRETSDVWEVIDQKLDQ